MAKNDWALLGNWIIQEDKITADQKNASLKIHFYARKVFMVMGSKTNKPIEVNVFLHGKALELGKGQDVLNSKILVNQHAIYEVIALNQTDEGVLQIISSSSGLEIYTFTFG